MRRIGLAFLLLLLIGCAPRGEIVIDKSAASVGSVERIFVAANRTPNDRPSAGMNFRQIDISVPPDRDIGTVRYPRPGKAADPKTEFLVTEDAALQGIGGFRSAIEHEMAGRPIGENDIVLFVHGFNTSYAEGVYRFAQVSHDLNLPGTRAHFSWVSHKNPLAYAADRDSVLYSRNDLVATITELTRVRGRGKVILVGHSMGAELLMEALQHLALSGRRDVLDQIGGVVLQAPDISVSVFRSQAKAIGKLPQPFYIFTSQRDRALRLSALVSNQPKRLGTLSSPAEVSDLEVVLVEVGAYNSGIGHFNAASSPALISILSRTTELERMFAGDDGGAANPFGAAAIRLNRAAQIIVGQ